MSKAGSMYAGSAGTNYNVNKNSPGNGNGKWQGLVGITNMRTSLVPYVKTRTGGENRNLVFCMNQLGGIGRMSNMFASRADGVHTNNCANSANNALGAVLYGSANSKEQIINVQGTTLILDVDDFDFDEDLIGGSVKSFSQCDSNPSLTSDTTSSITNSMKVYPGRAVSNNSYYNFTSITAEIDLSYLNSIDSDSPGGANCNLYLVGAVGSDGTNMGKYCDAAGTNDQSCRVLELDLMETNNSKVIQSTFHAASATNDDGTTTDVYYNSESDNLIDNAGSYEYGVFAECLNTTDFYSADNTPAKDLSSFDLQKPFTIKLTVDTSQEIGYKIIYSQDENEIDMTPSLDASQMSDGSSKRTPFKITDSSDAVYIVLGINSSYMAGGGLGSWNKGTCDINGESWYSSCSWPSTGEPVYFCANITVE